MYIDKKIFYVKEVLKLLAVFFTFEVLVVFSFIAGIGLRYLFS